MAHRIALLPGDGIGPEVVDAAVPLLRDVADAGGFTLELDRFDWNSSRWLETGELMPEDGPAQLAAYDAVVHGAMGHPDVPERISGYEGHLRLRREFDLYVNLRPAYLFEGVEGPLRGFGGGDIDIRWYRENSEGAYVDFGGIFRRGSEPLMAVQSAVYTREGVDRIARRAFEAAADRAGLVTNVTKSNAQSYGLVFWDAVVEDVAADFPDVALEHLYVDAANMDLVRRPDEFDVVLGPGLFSDILTDLAAAVVGGLGLAPSSNVNPDNDAPGMYEPIHGSAPDIAGRGIANPLATVLSAELLLADLGETAAASRLREAVAAQLADADAPRTPDLGGEAHTTDVIADLRGRF